MAAFATTVLQRTKPADWAAHGKIGLFRPMYTRYVFCLTFIQVF